MAIKASTNLKLPDATSKGIKPHKKHRKKDTGFSDAFAGSQEQSASGEGKNYKFYEDIVSFEDNGEKPREEQEYQLIGDDFKKVYVNETNKTLLKERNKVVISSTTPGKLFNSINYIICF